MQQLRTPREKSAKEEAKPEHYITVRAGIHNLLLYSADYLLVYLLGSRADFSLRSIQRDGLAAMWALRHSILQGKDEPLATPNERRCAAALLIDAAVGAGTSRICAPRPVARDRFLHSAVGTNVG